MAKGIRYWTLELSIFDINIVSLLLTMAFNLVSMDCYSLRYHMNEGMLMATHFTYVTLNRKAVRTHSANADPEYTRRSRNLYG